MNSPKNPYPMKQVSTGGKPEFETFRNEKDGLHYFHFKEEQGQVLLYSQGYKDARSRNNAIRSVEKNAHRTEYHHDEEGHYFIIRAGNNLEIARSRHFPAQTEMETVICQMQGSLLAGTAIGALSAQPARPATPASEKSSPVQPSRYRFSIEWQRRSAGEPLLGVIEYPVNGEKVTFNGIDTAAIGQFVAKFAAPAPAKRPERTPVVPAPPVEKALTFATAAGLPIEENLLGKYDALEVRMQLTEPQADAGAEEATFMAKVYAQSLDSGDRIFLATQQGYVGESGEIALAVGLDALTSGSYRMVSNVELHTAGSIRRLEGSRLMHLV